MGNCIQTSAKPLFKFFHLCSDRISLVTQQFHEFLQLGEDRLTVIRLWICSLKFDASENRAFEVAPRAEASGHGRTGKLCSPRGRTIYPKRAKAMMPMTNPYLMYGSG